MREVLESTERVVQNSRHVRIDETALDRFVLRLPGKPMAGASWDCHYHFCDDSDEMVGYLMVLDTLNFCFWALPGERRWERTFQSEQVSGYFGLAAALKLAFLSGRPVTDPAFLAEMTPECLKAVLGGRGTLPLLKERARNLRELGRVLLDQYRGKAVHLVEEAGKSAVALAHGMAERLPSFRDTAEYHGRTVFFYKRAQIFAADLHSAFGGKAWGDFQDLDRLTAFADYKLPQVLRHVGVLRYGSQLADKVDRSILLPPGSEEEVEIRAGTIWAVEQIRQKMHRLGRPVTASQIDGMLWTLGQQDQYRLRPYHKTLTIYY